MTAEMDHSGWGHLFYPASPDDCHGPSPWSLTFTAQYGTVPHHAALLQNTGDGLGALRPEEAFVTQEGDGAAQLQAVTEPLAVNGHARIWALVVSEG